LDQSTFSETKPPRSPKSPRTKSPKSPKGSPSLTKKGGKKGKKTPNAELMPTQSEVQEDSNKDKKTYVVSVVFLLCNYVSILFCWQITNHTDTLGLYWERLIKKKIV
jgi:hypothetical protein